MLAEESEKRPSAIQALAHPWFSNETLPLQSSMQLNKILARSRSSIPAKDLQAFLQKSHNQVKKYNEERKKSAHPNGEPVSLLNNPDADYEAAGLTANANKDAEYSKSNFAHR